MTVSTTTNRVIYRGNGAATNFAVPFKVLDEDHLIVQRRVFATGVIEHTYIGTDYSYAGIGASSGTLTLSGAALAATYELIIERIVPYTQALDIVNAGGFYPDTVEEQLDLIVMSTQQLADLTGRALLVPAGEDGLTIPGGADRPDKVFTFDSSGDPALTDFPAVTTAPGDAVNSLLLLAAISGPVNGQAALLTEAGREGTFVFDSSDLSAEVAIDTEQGVYVAPNSDATGASGAWVRMFDYLSPEMFGAVGDGVTDNYVAFVALADVVSDLGGARIEFGHEKTYYIGQYATFANGVVPVEFLSCRGLVIEGNGSKIDFKGDFDRDILQATDGIGVSGIGMRFDDIIGMQISNLELDGNVEQTTNSINDGEHNYAIGIRLGACEDVVLENVNPHHFANDGFQINITANAQITPGVYRASKRVTLINCTSEYNSRGAITGATAEWVTCINCSFSYTARHAGTYGFGGAIGHAPKFGFNLEPDFALSLGTSDIDPNNWHFINCRFIDNFGADWTAGKNFTHSLSFTRCHIKRITTAAGTHCVILGIPRSIVRDCDIDALEKRVELTTGSSSTAEHIFEGNRVRGYNIIFLNQQSAIRTIVRNNRFTCTATAPMAVQVITVNGAASIFEDNDIFVPAAAYVDGGGSDQHAIASLNGARRASRNRWVTDLTQTQAGATTAHYHPNYGTCEAIDERFIGTNVGTADTFRPAAGSTHNTNFYYNVNLKNTLTGSVTTDVASIAAGAAVDVSITVAGTAAGDDAAVVVSAALPVGVVIAHVRCTTNAVLATLLNVTAGALDPASLTYQARVWKR